MSENLLKHTKVLSNCVCVLSLSWLLLACNVEELEVTNPVPIITTDVQQNGPIFDSESGLGIAMVVEEHSLEEGAKTYYMMAENIRSLRQVPPEFKNPDELIEQNLTEETNENREAGVTVLSNMGKLYRGPVEQDDGMSFQYSVYKDDSSDVAMIFELNGTDINRILVGGEAVSHLPETGMYTYTGANFLTKSETDGTNRKIYSGSFTMEVDFVQGTGTISGNNDSGLDIMNSNLAINMEKGTFEVDRLNLVTTDGAEVGEMYGNFHDEGGTGVSGIYFQGSYDPENPRIPNFYGAIAGSR